jgi:hypothetical protein
MGESQDYAETWEGGFIRHDSKGRKVYVIRRMLNGRNYKVSTRATTLRAAMEQLKRFESDPEHYNPAEAPNTRSPSTSTRRSLRSSSPTPATWTKTAPPG